MQKPDYALIVAGPRGSAPLRDALRPALPVRTCPGAAQTYCPVLRGDPCPLRDDATVTVVYLAGEHEFFAPGQWECVTSSTTPAVVVLEGESHPPRGRNGFALVGAERGTVGVLGAMATLVEDNPTTDARLPYPYDPREAAALLRALASGSSMSMLPEARQR